MPDPGFPFGGGTFYHGVWIMAPRDLPKHYFVLHYLDKEIILKVYLDKKGATDLVLSAKLSKNQLLNLLHDAAYIVNNICHD